MIANLKMRLAGRKQDAAPAYKKPSADGPALKAFLAASFSNELLDVPGAVKKLAARKGGAVTNASQLVGKYLSFRGDAQVAGDKMYTWLRSKKINSHRALIIAALEEQTAQSMPVATVVPPTKRVSLTVPPTKRVSRAAPMAVRHTRRPPGPHAGDVMYWPEAAEADGLHWKPKALSPER